MSRQGCHSCPSPTRPCPPRSREGQRARRCRDPRRCLLAGVPPSPLPGGCSPPEGGGERQAGAEAGLGRPLPLTFRPPPPLSVPRIPTRGGVRTPGGSRLGALHRRARGRAGFAGGCEAPCRETPPLPPTPAVPSRPRSRGSPPKTNAGGGVFPYLSAGPGEPQRGGCWIRLVFSRRVPQQKLPPAAAGAGAGAGAGEPGCAGGIPRPERAARTSRAVFICRKEGNLSAYTKNRGC